MTNQEKDTTFLRHEACPKCGSEDNVSLYLNKDLDGNTYETKYCQTPGCDYMVTDNDVVGYTAQSVELPKYAKQTTVRGITPEVLRKYSSGISEQNGSFIFPYIQSYKLKCYKELSKHLKPNGKKDMKFRGDTNALGLYGQQTTGGTNRELIITEGEIDAMSAYQMTRIPSVSIPNGADSALKSIKANLPFIEKFRKVYVCFDNDEAGNKAADVVMDFLKAGSSYRVTLTHYKDANEYLINGANQKFKRCIEEATQKHVESLYTREETKSLFETLATGYDPVLKGLPTGFTELDKVFSLRDEEVTTVFADPAVGKSSFARQMIANLIHQKVTVLIVAYEESDLTYLSKIVDMYYGFKMSPSKYKEYYDDILENVFPYVCVAKLPGDDVKNVRESIEYAVRCYDVKVVFIDNITACTAGAGEVHSKIGEFYMMFTHLGKEYKHHTVVVSHTKRDNTLKSEKGEVPFMRQGYGSGGIERYSYNVLALGRAVDSNVTHVAIRKNRTTGDLSEFDITWDYETNSFIEVTDYGQRNSERGIRLDTGATVREDVPQEHKETPVKEETGNVHCNHSTELQPGFCDTMQERERICGGEREVQLSGQGNITKFDTRRKRLTHIGG